MSLSSPAVRVAVIGLLVLTAVVAVTTGLHLLKQTRQAERIAEQTVLAEADAFSRALSVSAERGKLPEMFDRLVEPGEDTWMALIGPEGLVLRQAGAGDAFGDVDWTERLEALRGERPVWWVHDDVPAVASVRSVREGTISFLAARTTRGGLLSAQDLWSALGAAALLWLLLGGGFLAAVWRLGPNISNRLRRLGHRVAQEGNPSSLIEHASVEVGAAAEALLPTAKRLEALRHEKKEATQQVAAALQINPHYVVMCTLDGRLIDANPAFYAITGLPYEAVRGGRIESLREVFPIEPLLEMATRSAREKSAISGIEYALVDESDVTRPVLVSLRAVESNGEPAVLIQATDVATQRKMERQVAAFSDTLDLMVDERVSQLTAGHLSLRRVLDGARVALVAFDASGRTSRWNAAAEAMLGCSAAKVPSVESFVRALALPDAERESFTQWMQADAETGSFVAHRLELPPGGPPRVRRIVWCRTSAEGPGRTDAFTLLGVELPEEPVTGPGDGQLGQAPIAASPIDLSHQT